MKKSRQQKSVRSIFRLVILLVSVFAFTFIQTVSVVRAHHMAPVDYNVTVGNLNEEMVHNGFDVGNMPDTPTIGDGNMNRAETPWTPLTPSKDDPI